MTTPTNQSEQEELREQLAKLAGLTSIEHTEVVAFHPDDLMRFIQSHDEAVRNTALKDAKDAVHNLGLKDPYGRQAWYAIDALIPHNLTGQNSETLTTHPNEHGEE